MLKCVNANKIKGSCRKAHDLLWEIQEKFRWSRQFPCVESHSDHETFWSRLFCNVSVSTFEPSSNLQRYGPNYIAVACVFTHFIYVHKISVTWVFLFRIIRSGEWDIKLRLFWLCLQLLFVHSCRTANFCMLLVFADHGTSSWFNFSELTCLGYALFKSWFVKPKRIGISDEYFEVLVFFKRLSFLLIRFYEEISALWNEET